MSIPAEIEAVALLGWRLYPASRTSKAACFTGATGLATANLETIDAWCFSYPNANWRVVMGGSGIWAIDVDAPGPDHAADGIKAMASLVAANSALPPRPMTKSGGGGFALFFAHNGEPISGQTGTPAPGIDPRRGGLSVTIPPSVHLTSGKAYAWITPPWIINPPVAPAWLLAAVAPPPPPPRRSIPPPLSSELARKIVVRAMEAIMAAGEGTRNATLNAQAYLVARFVAAGLMDEGEAQSCLYNAARGIGLGHREIENTLKSAFASGLRNPIEPR